MTKGECRRRRKKWPNTRRSPRGSTALSSLLEKGKWAVAAVACGRPLVVSSPCQDLMLTEVDAAVDFWPKKPVLVIICSAPHRTVTRTQCLACSQNSSPPGGVLEDEVGTGGSFH